MLRIGRNWFSLGSLLLWLRVIPLLAHFSTLSIYSFLLLIWSETKHEKIYCIVFLFYRLCLKGACPPPRHMTTFCFLIKYFHVLKKILKSYFHAKRIMKHKYVRWSTTSVLLITLWQLLKCLRVQRIFLVWKYIRNVLQYVIKLGNQPLPSQSCSLYPL